MILRRVIEQAHPWRKRHPGASPLLKALACFAYEGQTTRVTETTVLCYAVAAYHPSCFVLA